MSYRMTPQRMAILEVLEGNRDHPSAEDVYRAVRKRFPTMSLATVYNTLELFRRQGRVREIRVDRGRTRYDPDTGDHSHMICRVCGRIADIERSFPVSLEEHERRGYEIHGAWVEFHGICPQCRARR